VRDRIDDTADAVAEADETRDRGAPARPSGGGVRPSARHPALPGLPSSPAARHGVPGRVRDRFGGGRLLRARTGPRIDRRPPGGPARRPNPGSGANPGRRTNPARRLTVGPRSPVAHRRAARTIGRAPAHSRVAKGARPVATVMIRTVTSGTWQEPGCVTGVTPFFLRVRALTPVPQRTNLICAIAPPRTTPPRPAGTPPQPALHEATRQRPEGPRRRWTRQPRRVDGAAATTLSGHPKKNAPDSAESGAIRRLTLVKGYGPCWGRRPPYGAMSRDDRVWGTRLCPACVEPEMSPAGVFRPRCAVAEYPQAVRGPLPRDTGDAHRACGWT
jgi:hypothetical protein